MTLEELKELLYLTRENYKMLRHICELINLYKSNQDSENQGEFMRNILANVLGDKLVGKL